MIDPLTHVYSYSQLSSFSECPFSYYLGHLEEPRPEEAPNAFAQQGSLIHDLLDKWAKGELKKKDLPKEYEKRYYAEVTAPYPPMLASKGYAEKAYAQGLDYFYNFDEFAGYEVVSAEEEFYTDITLTDGSKRKFLAYVDLVLRDEFTGGLIVCDHKSKSWATFRKTRDTMYKQQYLYSYFVHEKYGEWPQTLMFNLFKECGKKDEQEFSKETFDQTMQWATDSIHKIEDMDLLEWMKCKPLPKNGKPDLFCTGICSWRLQCPQARA